MVSVYYFLLHYPGYPSCAAHKYQPYMEHQLITLVHNSSCDEHGYIATSLIWSISKPLAILHVMNVRTSLKRNVSKLL